ncbi:MAG TPA: acetolactate synthase small subunit [Candidatus Avimonoglobus intestinipullorum]|uniref:Acetolactate synthase small subunit n=1 Tax=Candidatus Avimonoglobus intestinipullorum TaxID=2840699 RepID=A0A9D1LUW0_9FIRM|nr:acetolactate synthase small subunit [Candidatus Avimonoglobus intestinipullorum]
MDRYTLSVLVENHAGVLSKVVGLFSRRGFNIHSLAVGVTHDETISRITIEVSGDENTVEQISKQLNKLIDVIKIKTLKAEDIVKRGLLMVKIKVNAKNRGEVVQIADIFRANIIDLSQQTVVAELTGGDNKLDAFLEMLEPYGIEELARTGMIALERGTNSLKV